MTNLQHQDSGADGHHASLAIHRVRFVNWSPSTVTALAVSPTFAGTTRGLLAIGRQNGNIELCTWVGPRAAQKSEFDDRAFQSDAAGWAVHTILPGQINSKIEQLCFVNPPNHDDLTQERKLRLFSISGGSIVTEHYIPLHLAKLGARRDADIDDQSENNNAAVAKPGTVSSLFGTKTASNLDPHYPGETRTLPSLAGAVWSMAPSATGRYLALGCEDGSVRIIDLENNRFEHLASTSAQDRKIVPRFGKAKGKVISLCWGPPVRSSKRAKANNKPTSSRSDSDSDSSSDDSDSDSDDDDEDEADQWQESFLVGGLALSTAVVWDASTGNISTKLSVQKNRTESTIVWSVATLPDGTIVTGDSTGRVTFFDPQTRIPIPEATFRAHAASSDVLALCIGPDGKTVYSAGVDQKVGEYTKLDTSNGRGRWIHIASRRLHAHDIRALSLDPPYSPIDAAQAMATGNGSLTPSRLPVLISGGVDFNLVLTPASPPSAIVKAQKSSSIAAIPSATSKPKRTTLTKVEQEHASINPISSNPLTTFADTTQRRVPFVPTTSRSGLLGGGSVAALCPSKGWIVLRREQSIGIWDLGSRSDLLSISRAVEAGEPTPQHPNWVKLLEMEVKVDSNIVCVAISNNGQYLAVSDLYETKLFELKQRRRAQDSVEIEPKKIKSFGKVFGGSGGETRTAPSASALRFSPDSTRLVVCSLTGAYVHVLELPSGHNDSTCKLLRSFGQHRRSPTVASSNGERQIAGRTSAADRTERSTTSIIQHAEISSDGAWLSTISSDLQHHIFNLDSLTFGRTLPSPSSLPTGVVFHPSTGAKLCGVLTLVFASGVKVEFWNVESGKELSLINGGVGLNGQRKKEVNGQADGLVANLSSLKQNLQLRLASLRDFAVGALWVGTDKTLSGNLSDYTLILWGATWICTARSTTTITTNPNANANGDGDGNGDGDVEMKDIITTNIKPDYKLDWTIRTTAKYQPLLLVAQVQVETESSQQENTSHLVVIERPYFELAKKLPPTFHRGARYGA
ncbi:related to UTP4 - U3 snoRNP protein [Ustilago trichophora]|uniref:Related to UTP4 - U3 snoRNP protein n=1 Tax=Ustilago trichophora TaxID=86804 RepID=A0A5C3DUH1_9BASI|nr:related to UTP4 - U3 snoRNP protein [Ustilago trichophora]